MARATTPKVLPILKQILSVINPEILPNPAIADVVKWETIIESKDAPILAAALLSQSDRLLSLNIAATITCQSRKIYRRKVTLASYIAICL